jgi:ABC-type nitrate/sulfonate/bicarbonate transport system permease component
VATVTRTPVRRRLPAALGAAVAVAGLLGAWEAVVRTLAVPGYLVPRPSAVWAAFLDLRPVLPAHLAATVTVALAGLGLAAVTGAALAVALTSVALLRRLLSPVLVVSQTIPMIVLAPLLIAWFGFGLGPKVLVVALVGFFPVVISTVDGIDSADRELLDLVRSMGASRAALVRHVLLPAALPSFFAGLTVAATYAMVGAVVAEWMGATAGLGLLMTRSQASYRLDQVFVGIALVAAVSVALFLAVRIVARAATPWTTLDRAHR